MKCEKNGSKRVLFWFKHPINWFNLTVIQFKTPINELISVQNPYKRGFKVLFIQILYPFTVLARNPIKGSKTSQKPQLWAFIGVWEFRGINELNLVQNPYKRGIIDLISGQIHCKIGVKIGSKMTPPRTKVIKGRNWNPVQNRSTFQSI